MGGNRDLLKWIIILSILTILTLIDATAWGAINVTRAVYRLDSDQLFVIAASDRADQADLHVEIPNIGSRAMDWKSGKHRWQKGLQPGSRF